MRTRRNKTYRFLEFLRDSQRLGLVDASLLDTYSAGRAAAQTARVGELQPLFLSTSWVEMGRR